jgi:hypothetical protein
MKLLVIVVLNRGDLTFILRDFYTRALALMLATITATCSMCMRIRVTRMLHAGGLGANLA